MTLHRLFRVSAVLLLVLAACWTSFSGLNWLLWRESTDYGTWPPEQMFRRVMGHPVPPGLTNLRVAGHCSFAGLKHWVWMSFDTTDEALRSVIQGQEPQPDGSLEEQLL